MMDRSMKRLNDGSIDGRIELSIVRMIESLGRVNNSSLKRLNDRSIVGTIE